MAEEHRGLEYRVISHDTCQTCSQELELVELYVEGVLGDKYWQHSDPASLCTPEATHWKISNG